MQTKGDILKNIVQTMAKQHHSIFAQNGAMAKVW